MIVFSLALANAGCASVMPRDPVPRALAAKANVPGMEHVRFWGDEVPKDFLGHARRWTPNLVRREDSTTYDNRNFVVNYLALSSGGADGAFGAGLLVGWTKSETRPRFDVVTGISAGALIAPFAFLGPAYDRQLREVWTNYGTNDLLVQRPLAGILGGPALADTAPLAELIAKYVDQSFLDAVARQHLQGSLLLIGTTNLDAQRPVVWNMGQIAISGHPRALPLFRQVLLAAVSIPGVFPSVHIDVEANGQIYEEMHVDGGTTREVFIAPVQLSLRELDPLYVASPFHRVYVIKNSKLTPEWNPVEDRALTVGARALSTLIKSEGEGDLFRIYMIAKRDGAEFNLAGIPERFNRESKERFDLAYMRALFDVGFAQARAGYRWLKSPLEIARNRSPS